MELLGSFLIPWTHLLIGNKTETGNFNAAVCDEFRVIFVVLIQCSEDPERVFS